MPADAPSTLNPDPSSPLLVCRPRAPQPPPHSTPSHWTRPRMHSKTACPVRHGRFFAGASLTAMGGFSPTAALRYGSGVFHWRVSVLLFVIVLVASRACFCAGKDLPVASSTGGLIYRRNDPDRSPTVLQNSASFC